MCQESFILELPNQLVDSSISMSLTSNFLQFFFNYGKEPYKYCSFLAFLRQVSHSCFIGLLSLLRLFSVFRRENLKLEWHFSGVPWNVWRRLTQSPDIWVFVCSFVFLPSESIDDLGDSSLILFIMFLPPKNGHKAQQWNVYIQRGLYKGHLAHASSGICWSQT